MTERVLVFRFDQEDTQRLDHFLVSQMPDYSRSFLQSLIREGAVHVDGAEAAKTGLKLERQHVVEVRVPPIKASELLPEPIPLDVVYEDSDLIVINKPAGMVVHPSAGHESGTLVHAVLVHSPDIEGVGGERRPGLVHRLDKNTSGLIVLAKNDATHRFLQQQFKDRVVEKYYLALVDGQPPTPNGRVEAPIGRDTRQRQRMAVRPENRGRMAISEYQTLESFYKHALLQVRIYTGRTHQVRVHMAFLECPVAGDTVYGHRNPTIPLRRQFLHAARLGISLPSDQKRHFFGAPLPPELERTLTTLRV